MEEDESGSDERKKEKDEPMDDVDTEPETDFKADENYGESSSMKKNTHSL